MPYQGAGACDMSAPTSTRSQPCASGQMNSITGHDWGRAAARTTLSRAVTTTWDPLAAPVDGCGAEKHMAQLYCARLLLWVPRGWMTLRLRVRRGDVAPPCASWVQRGLPSALASRRRVGGRRGTGEMGAGPERRRTHGAWPKLMRPRAKKLM